MQFYHFCEKAKQGPSAIYNYLLDNTKKLWKRTESTRELITQGGIALYTSFSAFKSTIEMIPLIASILTVLATAPLMSYFLPTLLFDTTVIVLMLASISGLVGYYKYHELKLRNDLDKQTKEHSEKIKEHSKEIKELKKDNGQLNKHVKTLVHELEALKSHVNINSDILPAATTTTYSLRSTDARQHRIHQQPANDRFQPHQKRPKAS